MHARFAMATIAFVFCTTSGALAGSPPSEDDKAASKSQKGREHGEKGHEHGERAHEHGEKGESHDKGHEHEADGGKHDKLPPGLVGRGDERHKRLLERFEMRKNTLDQRRRGERDEIRRRWGKALDKPAALEELRRHAMIVARLERIKDIADSEGKPDLATRATAALEREKALHDKKMAALASPGAAPSASGGAL